jgi:predicted RNA-binding protein YlxR (DUF448 family)
MLRFALRDGVLSEDPQRRLPGRGAYVCDAACAQRGLTADALRRALRREVIVPDDLLESVVRG